MFTLTLKPRNCAVAFTHIHIPIKVWCMRRWTGVRTCVRLLLQSAADAAAVPALCLLGANDERHERSCKTAKPRGANEGLTDSHAAHRSPCMMFFS